MPINRRQLVGGFISAGILAGCAEIPLGNDTPASSSKMAGPQIDLSTIRENFRFATAPQAWQVAQVKGYSAAEAMDLFKSRMPGNSEFTIFPGDNKTSAMVLLDRDKKKITVALAPVDGIGAVLNDIDFFSKPHPLGGKVHGGFYGSVVGKDSAGRSLLDQITRRVSDYAKKEPGPIDINVTGFSRGGSTATALVAQWLADGFPKPDSNLKLKGLYSFGAPPVGDATFDARFAEAASKRSVQTWRIVAAGDPIPQHMTRSSWYGAIGSPFAHIGTAVYMFPPQNPGGDPRLLIDPTSSMLRKEFLQLTNPVKHGQNAYADLLSIPDARMPDARPEKPQPKAPTNTAGNNPAI